MDFYMNDLIICLHEKTVHWSRCNWYFNAKINCEWRNKRNETELLTKKQNQQQPHQQWKWPPQLITYVECVSWWPKTKYISHCYWANNWTMSEREWFGWVMARFSAGKCDINSPVTEVIYSWLPLVVGVFFLSRLFNWQWCSPPHSIAGWLARSVAWQATPKKRSENYIKKAAWPKYTSGTVWSFSESVLFFSW